MLLLLKIQNLIPVFLNSSTHGFFSLFVYYRCNQIIMFSKKLSNISFTVVCIVISKIFSPHYVTFKEKNTYSFRDEREWLLRCREREQEWRIPFPRVGNIKRWKKRSQLRERQGNEKKNIDAITPRNGNRNGENKKGWYDYTKKYLEIFGVRLSFVTKYSETPPPPFLTTPPFSEATGIPAHPCIHFVRVVTS